MNIRFKRMVLVLFCFIALLAQQCKYRNLEDIRPNAGCQQSLVDTVSFGKDIKPILANNCSISGCHSGPSPKGNFNLESSVAYTQLLKPGSGYVDTINPKFSVVYSSLVSKTSPMPPTGRMDQCSIDLIEKWMKQGAKNN